MVTTIANYNLYSREFLLTAPPAMLKSRKSYNELNRLVIEQGDVIAVIDGRTELHLVKGQNQRTFVIGLFPR